MSDHDLPAPMFAAPARQAAFLDGYRSLLTRWPAGTRAVDVETSFGRTRVQVCGADDGAPVVLLHGDGATSTVWFANAGALGRSHRMFAPDKPGGPGLSVVDRGHPMRRPADVMGWVGELLDGLGLARASLVGHSYGGWIALCYALEAPHRVERLVLLDPTDCFAGLRIGYRLRAVPLFVRPSAARMRAFLAWEASGRNLHQPWAEVMAAGAEYRGSKVVMPRRPSAEALRRATTPTLVLLAGDSKAHDVRRVEQRARSLMPSAEVHVVPGVSHHAMPIGRAEELNRELTRFLR